MPDNQDPGTPGNPDPAAGQQQQQQQQAPNFSWKTQLAPDFANSPTMQKFPDTKEGMNEAIKSHLSLERMLGHEKIPIPKGKDDAEGWAMFSKALGIPDKPDGYNLQDAQTPEGLKGVTFDKAKFAEIVHANKLTPDQAKGLWGSYTEMTQQIYQNAMREQQTKMNAVINQMRGEWGDAYQTKVELGQMVINKFSANKEQNDYLNAVLASDPQGIKFLATIGEQFTENKIGDFKYQKHSLTPEEAQEEISNIRRDPNHPYNNTKATDAEHLRAVDHVNNLLTMAKKAKG